MNWSYIKKFFPIIGVGLFIYLLIKLDVVKIFNQITSLNIFYLGIAFLLFFIFFFFQTLKWTIIAWKQRIDIPFKDAFKINVISDFYGFVTPAKIGGVIRADYLKKYDGGNRGLSNFVIDKVLDLSSLFILAFFGILISFLLYQNSIISEGYVYLLAGIAFVILICSVIFYKKESSRFLLKFIYKKFLPEKIKEKARLAFENFYEKIPSVRFLFFVFVINIISWIINYSAVYFIGLSLGININFLIFLSILPISTLIAQIPITINGLGTREVTMISLFGIFAIDSVKVFSMSLLGIVIANIIPSILAIIFLIQNKKNEVHNI
ncbi:MAG: flippase-like domain-containing protein [Candidatus Pacearchaeota archaeon]|nr:flippase-like domain-containing protein [Candidatus Pacearchaeota archaeon]